MWHKSTLPAASMLNGGTPQYGSITGMQNSILCCCRKSDAFRQMFFTRLLSINEVPHECERILHCPCGKKYVLYYGWKGEIKLIQISHSESIAASNKQHRYKRFSKWGE